MKIKELISKLQNFDPETLVVVGGFDEEGYDDIGVIGVVKVEPRKSQADIIGAYQTAKSQKESNTAVLIDHY